MLTLRLTPEIDSRLSDLAAKTAQSKSFLAREAILLSLEDVEQALAALEAGEGPVSLEDLEREFAAERAV
jgi:predicted transcriptional regulator